MFLRVSLFAAIVGVVLAGAAALMPDTGVNGTPGALIVLLGTVAVTVVLGIMASSLAPHPRPVWAAMAMIVSALTALAAWFLMQNALVAALVISILAQGASCVTIEWKPVT